MTDQSDNSRYGLLLSSEKVDELFSALAAAQSEMPPAIKNKRNADFQNGDYSDLNQIRTASLPALTKHELCLTQQFYIFYNENCLVTTLGHSTGQYIRSIFRLRSHANDYDFGSHLSYMRRYAASAIIFQSQADDDGQQGQKMYITEIQAKLLQDLVNARDMDMNKFKEWLKESFNATTFEEIPAGKYNDIVSAVKFKPLKGAQ